MVDFGVSYTEYRTLYPETALSEVAFLHLAEEATHQIHVQTRWRTTQAAMPEELAILKNCHARLVHDGETWGADPATLAVQAGITGVNNHGYSENYASAQSQLSLREQIQRRTIRECLSAPATRWMLYAGGVL